METLNIISTSTDCLDFCCAFFADNYTIKISFRRNSKFTVVGYLSDDFVCPFDNIIILSNSFLGKIFHHCFAPRKGTVIELCNVRPCRAEISFHFVVFFSVCFSFFWCLIASVVKALAILPIFSKIFFPGGLVFWIFRIEIFNTVLQPFVQEVVDRFNVSTSGLFLFFCKLIFVFLKVCLRFFKIANRVSKVIITITIRVVFFIVGSLSNFNSF
uniref:Uncharacterized protein n=1 Tax=Phage sp. cty4N14 TaxID=2825799 RepID=A0A8S5U4Y0_9VIRU|nr:MAG TPA: hypothetical protein [Phage sp. cty4N14]